MTSGAKQRGLVFGLLASTALVQPALAQTTQAPPPENSSDTPPPPQQQAASDGLEPDVTEIVVTATKREENLQDVPVSIQAIGTRRLDQLNISNFEDYTKQLPSVSFLTTQPGVTTVYMRGVSAAGGTNAEGNHSGSLPQVGTYLDEQPVTTIGGTLDVHIYDIARIESLSGPQGTLYGASSEAGTIRIITNKPELGVTAARMDGEINKVAHGGVGGKLDGMINLPITDNIAFRGVAFYQRDAGFIDNVLGTRTYYIFSDIPDLTITNAGLVEKNFNDQRIYGGRAALKIDLDENWTVTPTVMHQNLKSDGAFAYDPKIGDLEVDRLFPEVRKDKFTQAALTVEGKIGNFDVTYAGAYLRRPTFTTTDYSDYADAYDQLYSAAGGLGYFYYSDGAGNSIDPRQRIDATDKFKKLSQEVRLASPQDQPVRAIVGAFYQRQTNDIFQDYIVDNLAPELSVNGRPGTLWLTKQKRKDKDYALFGEASWDVTPQVTLTAGGRLYKFDNSLFGFFGFGRDPLFRTGPDGSAVPGSPPPNVAGSSRTGVAGCYTVDGDTLRDSQQFGTDETLLLDGRLDGTFCTNLATFKDGKLVPKRTKGSGFLHRLNAQYKPTDDLMFYGTWSRGFRPGGINRRATLAPYDEDFLHNYELGWKTSFGALRWNGAIYRQVWKKFQFSFLGENSFTQIQNARDARINGVESDISYVRGGWTINASAAYTDAKTKGNICALVQDRTDDCSLILDEGTPDEFRDFIAAPSGTRLPITPNFKGSATARYTWPVLTDARAHVQAGVAYQSSAPATLRTLIELVGSGERINPRNFLGKLRSFTLFDVAGGISWRRYNVELYAQNLFDKRNDLSRYVACASCTRTLVVPGTPRTIGLRVGTRF